MDLYTFGTPNGHKVSIMLEELGLPYKKHLVNITKGEQMKPEFLAINPNNKIPALVDGELKIFESIAIMIYLAEKTGKFLPKSGAERYHTLQWAIFQAAGVGPMFGQFGHFNTFAKEKIPYAIERYQTESYRLMGVMDGQLAKHRYLAGEEYSIADMATWPWVRGFDVFYKNPISREKFPNLMRWYDEVGARPAVQKGIA